MSLDDPKAWRSTLDKSTGHTYFYHKKTRVSQWVKPDCLIAEEEREREAEAAFSQHKSAISPDRRSSASDSPARADVIDVGRGDNPYEDDYDFEQAALSLAAANAAYGNEGEGGELDIEAVYQDYDDTVEYDDYEAAAASAEAAMDAATAVSGAGGAGSRSNYASASHSAAAATGVSTSINKAKSAAAQIQAQAQAQALSSAASSSASGSASAVLDPAAVSMVSQLVEQIALGSPEEVNEALELLLACCIPRTVDAISAEPGVLSTLAGAVLRSRFSQQRRLALKILWCLSTGALAASVYFVKDQGWAGLGEQVSNWGDDIESLLIYTSMLALLLGNPASRQIIDIERASHLADLVEQVARPCNHASPIEISVRLWKR